MSDKYQISYNLNQAALTELNNRNNYSAFQILKLNQKLYPNVFTNNNLGVFILMEGWISDQSGRGKNRNARALKYLNRARENQENYLTLSALGSLYFETKHI